MSLSSPLNFVLFAGGETARGAGLGLALRLGCSVLPSSAFLPAAACLRRSLARRRADFVKPVCLPVESLTDLGREADFDVLFGDSVYGGGWRSAKGGVGRPRELGSGDAAPSP